MEDKWIITDGNRFIYKNHKNEFVPICGEMCAEHFTKEKAENILNYSLSKPMRKIFYLKKVEPVQKTVKVVTESKSEPKIKVCSKKNQTDINDNPNIEKWMDRMKSVCVLSKDAAQRQTELRELLSQTDKELSDLDHYLEFSKLNACEMWYQGDKRKQVLKKRREVKNELELVAQITKLDEATEKLNKSVDNMMHRKYVPRVLKNYFV